MYISLVKLYNFPPKFLSLDYDRDNFVMLWANFLLMKIQFKISLILRQQKSMDFLCWEEYYIQEAYKAHIY